MRHVTITLRNRLSQGRATGEKRRSGGAQSRLYPVLDSGPLRDQPRLSKLDSLMTGNDRVTGYRFGGYYPGN